MKVLILSSLLFATVAHSTGNLNDSDLWDNERIPLNEAIPEINLHLTSKCWTAVVNMANEEGWYHAPSWYTYCMQNEYKKI